MPLRARTVTCRAIVVLTITLYAVATAITSMVMGILLRLELEGMQATAASDPEKKYIDECMRDFENLDPNGDKYRSKFSECVKELADDESLKRLPDIRLTVDERVCDPDDLCSGGDPGNCNDEVTQCYNLIDKFKAEQDAFTKRTLLERLTAECTGQDRWNKYENKVQLDYCLWKHLQTGVCTNRMRTNCPSDSSCCPVSQNDPLGSPEEFRTDKYFCQKSPIVGLYCQHRDYRIPVNKTLNPWGGPLCKQETCQNFGWCRDLADIPGLCLTDVCKDHRHAMDFLIVGIVFVGLGLIFDFVDIVLLIRWPTSTKLKSTGNAVSACLKLLSYLFCLAGGLKEFLHDLVDMQCFNEEGNSHTVSAKDSAALLEMLTLLTIVGSLALAPMSMQWGGQLVGLPYARVH